MLAGYHQLFLIGCFVFLFLGMYFIFLSKNKEWNILFGWIILGFNMIICWITIYGFHAVEVIGYDGDHFEEYAYADMFNLWVLPFVIFILSIVVCWIGWGKHLQRIAEYNNQKNTIRDTDPYWQ